MKNCLENDITISYKNKNIINNLHTKVLGLIIDKTSWKCHIDQLVTKLNSSCYAVRIIKDLISQKTKDVFFLCTFSYDIWYDFLGLFAS
jgi:hypothetical protein